MMCVVSEHDNTVVVMSSGTGDQTVIGLISTGWFYQTNNGRPGGDRLERQDVEKALGISEDDVSVNLTLDRLVERQRRRAECL